MGGVLKCIADDDDHSGGFELSCEIYNSSYFLVFKHKIPLLLETHVFCFVLSHERKREILLGVALNYPKNLTYLKHFPLIYMLAANKRVMLDN